MSVERLLLGREIAGLWLLSASWAGCHDSGRAAARPGVIHIPTPCSHCRLANTAVSGISASEIYVVGSISAESSDACTCAARGFLRHFDGEIWSTPFETSEPMHVLRGAWAQEGVGLYTMEYDMLPGGQTNVWLYDGSAMRDLALHQGGFLRGPVE